MRKITILFICFLLFQSASAQSVTATEKPSAVSKGKNIINVYYGYRLNLVSSWLKNYETQTGFSLKTFGPVGLVYEHLVTDNIGIGAEFGYDQMIWSYTYTDSYYSGSGNYTTYTDTYKFKYSMMRIQFRANFHFAKSEKFDAYGLISAGYRKGDYTYSYTTTDPNSASYNTNSTGLLLPGAVIPIGLKPGIGFRYFFTNNIGINLEIALGNPLMCGGLSLKF